MDLDRLVRSVKGDLFARWMRRAQKQALIEWRDRTDPPGLMARFERGGVGYYNFSGRVRRRSGGYFVHSGGLREMMRRRRPVSKNNRGTDVVTVFKYGGGALNFLTDKRGTIAVSKTQAVITVQKPAVTRSAADVNSFTRNGGIVVRAYTRIGGPVKEHVQRRSGSITTRRQSDRSYAQEFGAFTRDRAWIVRRTEALFASIARRAAVDRRTGGIKSNVLRHQDGR